jgi:hypothetical protein
MSVLLVWAPKDPNEVAKRNIDWTAHSSWRDGDQISSASFTLSTAAGMTIDDSDHDDDTISIVTLGGGTDGLKGKVLAEVVTLDGQTLQQTATILVSSR